jgi:hypothetical protein
MDENGNMYLVQAESGDDDDLGGYGTENQLNEEDFIRMMEREANDGSVGRPRIDENDEHNSTIINSSKNTSLEDNFMVE